MLYLVLYILICSIYLFLKIGKLEGCFVDDLEAVLCLSFLNCSASFGLLISWCIRTFFLGVSIFSIHPSPSLKRED